MHGVDTPIFKGLHDLNLKIGVKTTSKSTWVFIFGNYGLRGMASPVQSADFIERKLEYLFIPSVAYAMKFSWLREWKLNMLTIFDPIFHD